jgi:hypothetical protein
LPVQTDLEEIDAEPNDEENAGRAGLKQVRCVKTGELENVVQRNVVRMIDPAMKPTRVHFFFASCLPLCGMFAQAYFAAGPLLAVRSTRILSHERRHARGHCRDIPAKEPLDHVNVAAKCDREERVPARDEDAMHEEDDAVLVELAVMWNETACEVRLGDLIG